MYALGYMGLQLRVATSCMSLSTTEQYDSTRKRAFMYRLILRTCTLHRHHIVDRLCMQWRRKIVEFRGAEARRRAALPCFSPASIELFIATNSHDDSLLLSWVHSDHFHQIQTNYQLLRLHLFASPTRKERCMRRNRYSNYSTNRVKLFKIMLG